jgi:signal transduction histidine kinase
MTSPFLAARIDRWARSRALFLDRLVAGVGWVLLAPLSGWVAGVAGLLLATGMLLPLAVRRRFPVAGFAWSAGLFAVQLLVVPVPLPANLAQAVAIYTVAAHVPSLGVRLGALLVTVGGGGAAGFRWSTPPDYRANAVAAGAGLAVLSLLVWVIGNLVRGRETNLRALAAGRRQAERLAAAREIHDVVAHSLTVVVVQADAGALAGGDRAVETLETIGRTARTALAEVRGVIDVLREPDDPPPAPIGLADLTHVVTAVRNAGLAVELDADPRGLAAVPPAAGVALLRVVRESLTNVVKHAGAGAAARVTVARAGQNVRVIIEDDGPGGVASGPGGHGIAGMRERVRAAGGELTAGPVDGGGFRVVATLRAGR